MTTTANYLLIAYVGGEQYHFEYEKCGDKWEALDQFWHEDWECKFARMEKQCFAVDVVAMYNGKAIKCYEVAFEMSYFHHFYDHGHITLNEFSDAIRKIRADLDEEKKSKPDPKQMKGLMDRWAGFCYNHPPYDEVILWMVGGSKQYYLYQHFCSKFLHLCSVCHEDTMSAWIKFYRELDDQWAERLMEYVYCEWKN